MKIVVIGSGGREHAMCLALRTHPDVRLWVAPGNPGMLEIAEKLGASEDNVTGWTDAIIALQPDFVVVGPEAPLVEGLTDSLASHGIACVGPTAAAASLEGSKAFARQLAQQASSPSPAYRVVTDLSEVDEAVRSFANPPVVKASGLAAGKGVSLPDTHDACSEQTRALLGGSLGDAGKTVVLEERLVGAEASLFYACDGQHAIALPHAMDHKRIDDGDQGPNTGGMGAIAPNPKLSETVVGQVHDTIVKPALAAMAKRNTPFCGFLFVGVMLTDEGPKLIEFNVRLGDPETQVILPLLAKGAFANLCHAMATGDLANFSLQSSQQHVAAVVLASSGYPARARKGDSIRIDPKLGTATRWFVHAGTSLKDHVLQTAGGRVGAVVAMGSSVSDAIAQAYAGVDYVEFSGMHYRTDIGKTAT